MELWFSDGPDGGIVAFDKNPKKWSVLPLARDLPLNGCVSLVAW
jgi:hypothetical protein